MIEHIESIVANDIGFITLNRPAALNALSLDMIRMLTQVLRTWREDDDIGAVVIRSADERAFCAGGDIRFLHDVGRASPQTGSALLEDFFNEEYELDYLIHHYPKPYIALMDGIIMGGGMGLVQCSTAGRMRLVTERARVAMPEVKIGMFPDVGGSYFLSRAPGQLGTYLGVTGETIGAADALYAGLADLFIPSSQLSVLVRMLKSTGARNSNEAIRDFVAPFQRQSMPADSNLAVRRRLIDRHFSHDDVAAIAASLASDADPFAQATLAAMGTRSPLMMGVTLAQLRRGATMRIADCLRMERAMVRHCYTGGEVLEGIRAMLIDKDAPRWRVASMEAVTPSMITDFFALVWPAWAHPLHALR